MKKILIKDIGKKEPTATQEEFIESGLEEELPEHEIWMSEQNQIRIWKEKVLNPNKEEKEILDSFKKAVSFTSEAVTIKNGIKTFPYLKHGQKGFILSSTWLVFLPYKSKVKFKKALEDFPNNRLFYFFNKDMEHPWVAIVPLNQFKEHFIQEEVEAQTTLKTSGKEEYPNKYPYVQDGVYRLVLDELNRIKY